MDTTMNFDVVIQTKELNDRFKKVGEVFEVASVRDDSFLLRDIKTKVAIGVVNFDDFDKHFVHKENFKGWTGWTPIIGFDGHSDAMYKTNRKKVIVKFLTDKVRGEACCHHDDDFNLAFGIQTAYLRCLNKANEKRKAELEKQIDICNENLAVIDCNIKENRNILERMINSLGE